jgi:hypothetical protein
MIFNSRAPVRVRAARVLGSCNEEKSCLHSAMVTAGDRYGRPSQDWSPS